MTKRRLCILAMALISISASKCVFADDSVTKDAVFQTVIEDFLTLTLDDTNMVVETSMTKTFGSGYVIASVGTNNAYGYTLSMQDSDDRNGLEREGYATASEENKSKYNISSVTADTAYANLADDSWGYFLGSTAADQATYKQIPFEATEILSSDSNTSGLETARVNFGVKTAEFRPSGLYEDEITFTLVATPAPVSLEQAFFAAGKTKTTVSGNQYYVMQDMTSEICSNATEIPSELQVVDNRDNKVYWIAKLADDKCWMTQNLDLNLESTPTNVAPLTSKNTDLNTIHTTGYYGSEGGYRYVSAESAIVWTPKRSTITNISSSGSYEGWVNSDSFPYSLDTGDWYWTDTWYETNGYSPPNYNYINIAGNGAEDKFKQTPYSGNGAHGHVGNYYNWSAVIASNNTSNMTANNNIPQNSICPKGWRLPKIFNGNTSPEDEYANLFRQYNITHFLGSPASQQEEIILTTPPLWFVRGGGVSSQGLGGAGHAGSYWSSRMYDVNQAYYESEDAFTLRFYSAGVFLDYGRRYLGASVRCIAR